MNYGATKQVGKGVGKDDIMMFKPSKGGSRVQQKQQHLKTKFHYTFYLLQYVLLLYDMV